MHINPRSSFWSKVAIGEPDDCWEWQGYRNRQGYGQTTDGYAHRLAWEKANRQEMKGMACHRCNNPPCCNPAHIYDGTAAQNMADAREAGSIFKSRNAGTKNPASKLTEDDVRAIRKRLAAGHGVWRLCHDYGVSDGTIRGIQRGRTWRNVV